MNTRIVIEPHAPEDLQKVVREGVILHNIAVTGAGEYYPLCVLLKSDHGEILGGVLGHIWAKCCHIAFLWVAPIVQGRGHGSALLQTAEAQAAERGCRVVQLETFSFQAPEFYARHGYETIGVLEDFPPGHDKHFLKKSLA